MTLGKKKAEKVCAGLEHARLIPHKDIRNTLSMAYVQGLCAEASVITQACFFAKVCTAMTRAFGGPSLAIDNRMRSVAVPLRLMGPLHHTAPEVAQLHFGSLTLAGLLGSCASVVESLWSHRHIPWRRQVSWAKGWCRLLEIFGWTWSRRDVIVSDGGERIFLPER